MRILVIDFETTGRDPLTCQVTQFAFMVLDTCKPLPERFADYSIRSFLFSWDNLVFKRGQEGAIWRNFFVARMLDGDCEPLLTKSIIMRMPEEEKIVADTLADEIADCYGGELPDEVVVGGKNVSNFDRIIFERLVPGLLVYHAVVDPTCFFTDFASDVYPARTGTMLKRLEANGHKVLTEQVHDAAVDVYHAAVGIWEMANVSRIHGIKQD